MKLRINLYTSLILLCSLTATAQKLPYQNPNLPSETRAKDLVKRLTLKEKVGLMKDISDPVPRLGIKKFNWWSEALHGYANQGPVSVFPEPIGMAASFDDQMVFKVFDAVSDEARAKNNDYRKKGESQRFHDLSVWTPNVNIFRDPRWGRGQETYGEDPYLTSRMGISVVKGLQGPSTAKYRKLLACAKHYAVHSGPEWSRHEMNVNDVNPRDLWETYTPAFKALVQEADVREVMCAYQRLDDEPCCGSTRLLGQILREDWGFKYLVVSDCGAITDFYRSHHSSSDATHAAAKAVLSGTDVECVGYAFDKIPDAVKRGLIKEKEIDKSVVRLMTQRFELGEMDDDKLVSWAKIPLSVVNSPAHQQLALDMAHETITLLQNRNNVLPLSKSLKKVALIGPNADDSQMLWGNYNGTPAKTVNILEGIRSKLSPNQLIYDKGCDLTEDKLTETGVAESNFDGKTGVKATYWNNRNMEGTPVATDQITGPIALTTFGAHQFAQGVNTEAFSAKYETVYKPSFSGEVVFKLEATGFSELFVDGKSVLKNGSWRSLPSKINLPVEAGKSYKIELRYKQLNNWAANLGFNFGKEIPVTFSALLNKVKDADVVIFAGGISPRLEGEEMPVQLPGFKGGDRTDIELPSIQRRCIDTLRKAGKKVIFVNCSGSAIAMVPESENCEAILQTWYAGQAGGQAIADVLFGDYNPSGKLPVTFYTSLKQLPDFSDYSMKGRTYRYMTEKPLFPFGFGLSYTQFNIGTARLDQSTITQNQGVHLTIPVANTGRVNGTEVLQIYIKKEGDTAGPSKTLRSFKRVPLPAGKTENLVVDLPYKSFETYNEDGGGLSVQPGKYELLYGNSSDPKDLKSVKITIK
ncbi:glycoside hydrolase family 3 C-terminal domain-containing protein [Mucilaginibacter sp. RS28]|uniref:Glycoside hydrolase family 3 C-terminal domain-containing protein n=1 Tax=Mucilaginibacter straminoryzae TaxID=2932774 RepID=A0A9X1X0M3_9SPHI|nr:xylan 1,4-beta-xylosidase [Mucilaginibacter straminoryzae]MCJ8208601.1 glycoside hydrolase family 3 C-terminal domain-containing protein [Mucilaginibacter straminoryzae]